MSDTSKIIRVSTASVSLVASSMIAMMILRSYGGLSTPYRRIIFGLSVGDVLQSSGIILGPFAAPKGTPYAPWAKGNIQSCEAVGFITTVGFTTIPMYTFALSVYFLLRVKYQMTRTQFSRKVEWILHFFIVSWNLIGCTLALIRKNFNASRAGQFCNLVGYPPNCDIDPDTFGECERGKDPTQASFIFATVPALFCLVGMVVCLGSLTHYVFLQESYLTARIEQQNSNVAIGSSSSRAQVKPCCCRKREITNDSLESQTQHRSSHYNRSVGLEVLVQSSLYFFSCLLTYFFIYFSAIINMAGKGVPPWSFYGLSALWPLGGFFTILIYTRPKVKVLRRRFPEYPWFGLFLTIILAGGDVPDESPRAESSSESEPRRQAEEEEDSQFEFQTATSPPLGPLNTTGAVRSGPQSSHL